MESLFKSSPCEDFFITLLYSLNLCSNVSKSTILKQICEDILFVINLIFSINYLPCGIGHISTEHRGQTKTESSPEKIGATGKSLRVRRNYRKAK